MNVTLNRLIKSLTLFGFITLFAESFVSAQDITSYTYSINNPALLASQANFLNVIGTSPSTPAPYNGLNTIGTFSVQNAGPVTLLFDNLNEYINSQPPPSQQKIMDTFFDIVVTPHGSGVASASNFTAARIIYAGVSSDHPQGAAEMGPIATTLSIPNLPSGSYDIHIGLENSPGDGNDAAQFPQFQTEDVQYSVIINSDLSSELAAAIANLQSQINSNTSDITSLTSQLQALQSASGTQMASDEARISSLESSRTTDEATITSLQAAETQDEANVAATQAALANLATKEQADVTNLQGQITGLPKQTGQSNGRTSNNNSLAYAGIGLGAAGVGFGVYDLFSTQQSSSSDSPIVAGDQNTPDANDATPGYTQP